MSKKYGISLENDEILLTIDGNTLKIDRETANSLINDIEILLKQNKMMEDLEKIEEKNGIFELAQLYLERYRKQIESDQGKYLELKTRLDNYFNSEDYKNFKWRSDHGNVSTEDCENS